jgi:hypothetical protein
VAKARTARQKAALRKAQLASARKRKGKGKNVKVSRTFGSAFSAGLRLGLSSGHNKRAGISKGRYTKSGNIDRRYQPRKNVNRRAAGVALGVMTATYGTAALVGAGAMAHQQYQRNKRNKDWAEFTKRAKDAGIGGAKVRVRYSNA